jgi:hypothetical protein
MLFRQLVCLAKMFFDQPENQTKSLQSFDLIYEKFTKNISLEKREEFINEDPATKSNQTAV